IGSGHNLTINSTAALNLSSIGGATTTVGNLNLQAPTISMQSTTTTAATVSATSAQLTSTSSGTGTNITVGTGTNPVSLRATTATVNIPNGTAQLTGSNN